MDHHYSRYLSDLGDEASSPVNEDFFTCRIGNVKVLVDLLTCLIGETNKDYQSDIIVSAECEKLLCIVV